MFFTWKSLWFLIYMLQETMHIVHMAIRSEFYIIIFSFFFNFYSHVQQTDLRNDKIFQIILTTKSQSLYKTLLSYTICIQKEIQRMWYYSLLFFFIFLLTWQSLVIIKFFNEIQKMQIYQDTYIIIICIYIISFIIVKQMS